MVCCGKLGGSCRPDAAHLRRSQCPSGQASHSRGWVWPEWDPRRGPSSGHFPGDAKWKNEKAVLSHSPQNHCTRGIGPVLQMETLRLALLEVTQPSLRPLWMARPRSRCCLPEVMLGLERPQAGHRQNPLIQGNSAPLTFFNHSLGTSSPTHTLAPSSGHEAIAMGTGWECTCCVFPGLSSIFMYGLTELSSHLLGGARSHGQVRAGTVEDQGGGCGRSAPATPQ